MVGTLLELAKRMRIRTLAEGVETAAEALACKALGFDLIQGFYYARPTVGVLVRPRGADRPSNAA
jgi:EAL domain-containing protein (putative c-di-GMP-specific phosphodiesterase class I)